MSLSAQNLVMLMKQRAPRHGPVSKLHTLNSDVSQPSLWPRYETSENEISCHFLQDFSVYIPHNCLLCWQLDNPDNNISSQHLTHSTLYSLPPHTQSFASKPWVHFSCIPVISCFFRCCEVRDPIRFLTEETGSNGDTTEQSRKSGQRCNLRGKVMSSIWSHGVGCVWGASSWKYQVGRWACLARPHMVRK